MRRLSFLLAGCILLLVSARTASATGCACKGVSSFSGADMVQIVATGFPNPDAIGPARSLWNDRGCGPDGSYISYPFLDSATHTKKATLQYATGHAPQKHCGTNYCSSERYLTTVTVYQFDGPNGDTPVRGLDPNSPEGDQIALSYLLAHEFGHLLGLADDECPSGLMNQQIPNSAVITSDECTAVDQQNMTPHEGPPQGKYAGCPYDTQTCNGSPIIISLDGGPYDLTSSASGVVFDLDGDGAASNSAWTAGGKPLAFLALDRNGNGTIDDGTELFGNFTPLANGATAGNGWIALAEFDQNHDGVINSNDPAWGDLLLWQDLNHDGIAQAEEISSVSGSSLRSISLDYHRYGMADQYGNDFRYKSFVSLVIAGQIVTEDAYDVFFVWY